MKKLKKRLLMSVCDSTFLFSLVELKLPLRGSLSPFFQMWLALSPKIIKTWLSIMNLVLFYCLTSALFVPDKFVKWVAHIVHYKSCGIVIDGKVISLTKQAVHLVRDLPFGGLFFRADYSASKPTNCCSRSITSLKWDLASMR